MDFYDFSLHYVREAVFDENTPANLQLPIESINWRSESTSSPIFTNDSDNSNFLLVPTNNSNDNNTQGPTQEQMNNETINDKDNTSDNFKATDNETEIHTEMETEDNSNQESTNNDSTDHENENINDHNLNDDIDLEFNLKEAVEDIVRSLIKFKVSPENKFHLERKLTTEEKKRRHSFDSSTDYNKKNKNQHNFNYSINNKDIYVY